LVPGPGAFDFARAYTSNVVTLGERAKLGYYNK